MKPVLSPLLLIGTILLVPMAALAQNPPTQGTIPPASGTISQSELGVIVNGNRRPPLSPEQAAAMQASHKRTKAFRDNAERLLREGKLVEAEAECRKAIASAGQAITRDATGKVTSSRPVNSESLRVLGEIHIAQGRYKEAIAVFEECYRSTRSARLDLGLALAYFRQRNYEAAKQAFPNDCLLNRYSIFTPADLPGMGGRNAIEATIFLARGLEIASTGYENAIREYAAAEKVAPKNPAIAYLYAMALVYLNREAEAMPRFAVAAVYGGPKVKELCAPWLRSLEEPERKALLERAAQGSRQ